MDTINALLRQAEVDAQINQGQVAVRSCQRCLNTIMPCFNQSVKTFLVPLPMTCVGSLNEFSIVLLPYFSSNFSGLIDSLHPHLPSLKLEPVGASSVGPNEAQLTIELNPIDPNNKKSIRTIGCVSRDGLVPHSQEADVNLSEPSNKFHSGTLYINDFLFLPA